MQQYIWKLAVKASETLFVKEIRNGCSYSQVCTGTYSHVVEGYSHPVVEVFAEERDLSVALAEVVEHDEVGVHLHADTDGLGGCTVRKDQS